MSFTPNEDDGTTYEEIEAELSLPADQWVKKMLA